MMYTVDEVKSKHTEAVKLGLSGAGLLADTLRARKVCNGIGAAWMWETLRELVSAMNPTLVLAADIHDLRYDSGGTASARKAADAEFLANALKLADHRYGWYDPRRYIVRKQAHKFHAVLRVFGNYAWEVKP